MSSNCCIYTKKAESNEDFKGREHILPHGIGGINTLPRGYVSDEVNSIFSKLELDFIRNNPLIHVYKLFNGQKTRKGHKRYGKVDIMLTDEGEIKLG